MLTMDIERETAIPRDMPTREEIDAFKCPPIAFGSPVAVYPRGIATRSTSELMIGWAMKSNGSTVSVFAVDQHGGFRVLERARHISDPNLRRSSDIRAEGAWDFTDFDKNEVEYRTDLERRIAALETVILGKANSDREVLLELARKHGLHGASKMRTPELRQKLVELKAVAAEESKETVEA